MKKTKNSTALQLVTFASIMGESKTRDEVLQQIRKNCIFSILIIIRRGWKIFWANILEPNFKDNFHYKHMRPVYLIILMETGREESQTE